MPAENNPPAIVLVRPQLGENIGAVARAMSNFGFTDLRLVAPKNGWPNPRAVDMAVGAGHIVEAARVFETVPAALRGVARVYATTSRGRDIEKRVISPEQAAQEMCARANVPTALLFGPERTGLENEDIILADALVTIPTSAENPSLNLAQSSVILGYEWCKLTGVDVARPAQEGALASKEEMQGFFDHLEGYLDALDYFRTPEKKTVMWQNLRNIFIRAELNDQEVRTLRGVIRDLYKRRKA